MNNTSTNTPSPQPEHDPFDTDSPSAVKRIAAEIQSVGKSLEHERKDNVELREQLAKYYSHLGLPWPLTKALVDSFDYAVGLRDGTVVYFERCDINADEPAFVTLLGVKTHGVSAPHYKGGGVYAQSCSPFTFDRGLAVRITDIMWAADAPHGS